MPNSIFIQNQINQNTQAIDVFPVSDLIKAWEETTGEKIGQVVGKTARLAADHTATILDVHVVIKLIKDLGIDGRVILKTTNGKQYVIFKGYAGTRSIFTATRYLASNPKVVDMAIGKVGVNRSIMSGARLTIFLIVPVNVLNHILSDQQTMTTLIGITATDLVKVGAASAIASLAATATATFTILAAGPIVVAIVVGFAAGLTLEELDRQFGVTKALIKALDDAYGHSVGELGRQLNQVERRLKWQIFNGQLIGKGIFY